MYSTYVTITLRHCYWLYFPICMVRLCDGAFSHAPLPKACRFDAGCLLVMAPFLQSGFFHTE